MYPWLEKTAAVEDRITAALCMCAGKWRETCLPQDFFPMYYKGKHAFLGIQSCVWVKVLQLVEKNALFPLSGTVRMNGQFCSGDNQLCVINLAHGEIYMLFLLFQVIVSGYRIQLRDLCNSSALSEFLTIQNRSVAMDSEAFLCTLPKETLHAAELAFRANLNPLKPLQVSLLLTLLRRSH